MFGFEKLFGGGELELSGEELDILSNDEIDLEGEFY